MTSSRSSCRSSAATSRTSPRRASSSPRRRTRPLLRKSALPALACALLVSACGGEERAPPPKLPAALAQQLAQRSDGVADRLEAGDACAARSEADALQAEAIAAVNEQRIPRVFQEELLGSVAALAESIECVPPPVVEDESQTTGDEDDEDADDKGHGKGKGKGKKKGKGKD